MSTSKVEKYPPEFFQGIKEATVGQFRVKVDGKDDIFPVRRAEVRGKEIILEFDMSGGDPGVNRFIQIVIEEQYLDKKVEFTGIGEPVYFLFQNAKQEWLAKTGWIRVWKKSSTEFIGLVGDVESGQPGNSKLEEGKFEVTLA